jgi:hypothetical protein
MAKNIKVTLEHHRNRRYHAIKHGAGRRPAITYGTFNLRYRDPQLGGKRVRVPLGIRDLTAALAARREKEEELLALPVANRKSRRNIRTIADEYLAEIKATRKKKTYQAYCIARTGTCPTGASF